MTLEARRKFAGLLPEVYKRNLYKEKGYSSIYEFAGRLAGLSNAQVDLTLRLERKFADKPVLRRALVEGEVSINKLSRITSIATRENEQELFEKTKNLSNRAVEVFIRGVKNCSLDSRLRGNDKERAVHVQKVMENQKPMHVQNSEEKLNLDSDIQEKLLELQQKGIDINEFLREALKRREQEIEEKKKEIGEEEIRKYRENLAKSKAKQNSKEKITPTRNLTKKTNKSVNPVIPEISSNKTYNSSKILKRTIPKIPTPSRYLNIQIKKILQQEHGRKCSIPHCQKSAKIIHHTQRFALNPIHDPRFLAPLCKEHHEIAHKIDVKVLSSGRA